ncbi:hypothetical protein F4810DRAFT_667004 [Camillea tinctor]|nr:hypothetical protein F4810DRAFT_667004 [Camillea tinctor]
MDFNFSMPGPSFPSLSSSFPSSSSSPLTFKADTLLGGGLRGEAWKFNELRDGRVVGSFVVKYAKSPFSMATIEKEIRILQRLQGHRHIAQLVLDLGQLRAIPPAAHAISIPERTTVYLVTEYVRNGTLSRFLQAARSKGGPIPNRVLWLIFLCLVRIALALARPTHPPPAVPPRPSLEQPPLFEPATGTHYQVYHGDLRNLLNLMFGDLSPPAGAGSEPEHALLPILKAIDFGEAEDEYGRFAEECLSPPVTAPTLTSANIRDVGIVMSMCLSLSLSTPRAVYLSQHPALDPDIYDLVVSCAHDDAGQRPTLANLYAAVMRKVSAAGDGNGKESEARVRRWLREVLFEGDTR